MALPGRGVEDVGVPGVERDVGDARPLPRPEDLRPRLPAVRRLEEPAVAALRPQRPLRRHPDDVGVLRMHDDLRDVLRVPEAEVLPARARVAAAVDAVAEADVPAADVLARAHPDDVGVRGIDRHAADRVRGLLVEERRPGGAGVHRLPHATGAHRHVPGARVRRVDRDVGDAPGHERGADGAELQAVERLGRRGRFVLRRRGGDGGLRAFRVGRLDLGAGGGPWSASSETVASDARRRAFMGDLRS